MLVALRFRKCVCLFYLAENRRGGHQQQLPALHKPLPLSFGPQLPLGQLFEMQKRIQVFTCSGVHVFR
jgi:hypothetical protein